MSHHVSAESRPDLVQICVGLDVQLCAVRSEAGLYAGGRSRSKCPSKGCTAYQNRRRLVVFDEMGQNCGVSFEIKKFQNRVVIDKDPIRSV